MTAFAVVTRGLTRRFGPTTAVRDLTLQIATGEVFGLLGPNGSGKTTTIRMLCGLLAPSAGTAAVAGIEVTESPDRIKERIGYMSQRFGLYEDLRSWASSAACRSWPGPSRAAGNSASPSPAP